MAWREAPALVTLRRQVNAYAPNRDKRSDGTKASAAHHQQNPNSDHDPDVRGVVCALDITHAPYWKRPVLDLHQFVSQLVASGDERLAYVIFERRIWERGYWKPYHGLSPHLEHAHVSCRHGAYADDARPWSLPIFGGVAPPPDPAPVLIPNRPVVITPPIAQPIPTDDEDDDMDFIRHPNGAIAKRAGFQYAILNGDQLAAERVIYRSVHGRDLVVVQVDEAGWTKSTQGLTDVTVR